MNTNSFAELIMITISILESEPTVIQFFNVTKKLGEMTQEERWMIRYKEVVSFIEANHRNPSRHRIEEHDMLNWVKTNRKKDECWRIERTEANFV